MDCTIEHLLSIRKEIGDCRRCQLSQERTNIVFGEGSPFSNLMFIGEGPGQTEDQLARPFVGRAGELLNKALTEAGLTRDDVYIANLVKCRPPGNRDPSPEEVATCSTFLRKQIDVIQPKVIVALGRIAASKLLQRDVKITKENGSFHAFPYNKRIELGIVFHPAYVLRNRTTQVERDFFEAIEKAGRRAYESSISNDKLYAESTR